MSQRTLVELNHDFCPENGIRAEQFGLSLQAFMRSGDPQFLPQGVKIIATRHHSEPEFRVVQP